MPKYCRCYVTCIRVPWYLDFVFGLIVPNMYPWMELVQMRIDVRIRCRDY